MPRTRDATELQHTEAAHGSLAAFTTATGAVAVAEIDEDVIVAAGDCTTNDTGLPVRSVIRSGDTMAGVIAALRGQGRDRKGAAELGAWVVGQAGDLATVEGGIGIVAPDIIDRIPTTLC